MLKHDWFYFKSEPFRCCRACGFIENPKITDGECKGKVQVVLRKTPQQELDDYEEKRTLRRERAEWFDQKPEDTDEDDEL